MAPRYERVGPFVYRRFVKRVNVTFVDDGEKVYYAQYIYYILDERLSNGRPDDPSLRVTNLNSAYLAVLAKVGGEQNLVRALTGPTLLQLFTNLGQPFGLIIAEVTTSKALPVVRAGVLQAIENTQNVSSEVAQQIFATTWANATAPDQQLWQTLGVLSQGAPASNLSAEVVDALWNPASPLPNLVNSTYTSTFLWFAATYLQDPTSLQTLAQVFSLEPAQLQMVLAWRSKFLMTTGVTYVFQTFNVTSLDDLFYLQWGTGSVTNGTSVQKLLAGSSLIPPLAGIPEFAVWAQDKFGPAAITFDPAFSRTLLNGTSGLFDSTNLGTFLYLVATGNEAALQQQFQLSLAQAGQVAQYLGYIGETFVDAALQQVFAAGGGLITTKTPQEWLWGAEDPLLKLLGMPATVALATNMTSEKDALNGEFTSFHYTGKGNIDNIARYIDYCGVRVYPAGTMWAEAERVDGTEGLQFRPSLDSGEELTVWSYELVRQIPLHYDEGVTLKGIDLYRYHVSRRFFLPQAKYYQTITGFANMTHVYNNVPIFISKPNMLDCEAEWRDKLVGMQPSDADDTVLDIEPYTGYTMNVAKQLQINIYVASAGSPLDLYNKDFLKEVIYPVFYANQQATIGDSEASDFKDQVYLLLTIRIVVFWVGIAVGSLLAAIGLVVLVFVILKNRSFIRGYEVIGDQFNSGGEDDVFSSSRSRVRS